jgi:hypothetical protein
MQTKGFRGQYQSPVTFFTLPFTSAVAREASRAQLLAAGVAADVLQWAPQLLKFPHPQLRSIGMVSSEDSQVVDVAVSYIFKCGVDDAAFEKLAAASII